VRRAEALLVLLLLACVSRAEQSCPWLNAATAAGVLDGEVTLRKVGHVCIFTAPFSQLGIDVHEIDPPFKLVCGPESTPLKAIGNEALACSPAEKNGRLSEQIVGRVRNQAFVIRLTTTNRSIAPSVLRDKVRLIAEQVAGILF
jgi:hypothetical protein